MARSIRTALSAIALVGVLLSGGCGETPKKDSKMSDKKMDGDKMGDKKMDGDKMGDKMGGDKMDKKDK